MKVEPEPSSIVSNQIADYVAALDVRIGDRVRWCGRWGEVVEISPTYKQRKGRWLTVALDGTPRRLHYFNVEILEAMRQFDGPDHAHDGCDDTCQAKQIQRLIDGGASA